MKYKASLIIVGLLAVFSMTICSSYSYWTLTRKQDTTNKITSGCLNLKFTDTLNDTSTSINLDNAFPMSDTLGMSLDPYVVTLTNDCSITAKYTLLLSTDSNNTLPTNKIKINLNDTTNTLKNGLLSSLTTSTEYNTTITDELTNKGITLGTTYELATGTISAGNSVTYNIRLWVDESVDNSLMDSTFKASVVSYQEATSIVN